MTLDAAAERRLFREAIRLVVGNQFGSLNMLQRRLGIDIHAATKVMDELAAQGILGPEELGASRPVLANGDHVDQLLERFPELPTPAAG